MKADQQYEANEQLDFENQLTKKILDQANNVPENPFEKINFLSRMLFFWINPLLKKACKRNLTQEDIFNLRQKDSCEYNFKKFNKVYEEVKNDPTISNKIRATFFRIYKYEIIVVVILYFFNISSNLLNLFSIQILLKAFQDPQRGQNFMLMVPGLLMQVVTFVFMSIIKSNYNFNYSLLTVRMSGALSMKIFQKTMSYPLQRNQCYKLGDILNMVQVDILQVKQYLLPFTLINYNLIKQIVSYIQNLFMIIFIVPFLSFAVYLCYSSVSHPQIILVMLACISVFFIISVIFGKIYGILQSKFMHQKDQRMCSLEEMMRGIKTIKYNGLEQFFDERIKNKREKEVKKLRAQNLLACVNNFIQNISNTVCVCIITISYGISSLSEFINISFVTVLPYCIQGLVVGMNSMKRIDHFLLEEFVYQPQQLQSQNLVGDQEDKSYSLILNNATFQWKNSINAEATEDSVTNVKQEKSQKQEEAFKIKNLNLKIKKGEFVVFYGDINYYNQQQSLGSGKSSILQGILGEMEVEGGEQTFKEMVKINGNISLSTQEPWIIQATVKENILFGQESDEQRYQQSLQACCLEEDIAYFVDGDQTNIGEKGDTLSGGQRKRVNLARAIYKDADIYFLDDPLCALDISVANHISRECLSGFLKSKTRIIFTNNLTGMSKADRIFVVKQGEVVNQGKYQAIKKFITTGEYDNEQEKIDEQLEELQSERILKSSQNSNKKKVINQSSYTKKLIKQEDVQQGTIKLEVFKEFIKSIGGIITVIAIVLILACFVLSQVYTRLLITGVKDGVPKSEQFDIMILYCICDGSRVLSVFLYEVYFVFRMVSLSKSLHKSIVFGLLRASFTKFYNLITTGRLMNRLSKDIYEIDILIPKDLNSITNSFGFIIVSVIACSLMCNIKVIPIIVAYLFLSIFITVFFLQAKRQVVRIEATSKSPILQYFSEVIRGIFYLRNCVDHSKMKETFKSNVDVDLRNQIAVNGVQYWYECFTSFLSMFPIIVACIITFYETDQSPNASILMASLVFNASLQFINFSSVWISYETHLVNYERCFQLNKSITYENYEAKNLNNATQDNSSQMNESDIENNISWATYKVNKNKTPLSIVFEDASFQYREDIPNCLTNLNLRIQGNEKVGVVGRTGAGKTSITLALTKIIDLVSGDVIINGKSINNYSLQELRNTISVVSQEPFIFEGNLKQNLDPYGQYSSQEIMSVYSKCGFSSCNSFKQGLNTEIQQLGDNLSEGEKQLISIARIILRKSSIIIVDEPTSHIDAALEDHVTKLLNESFKDCLMITIAHKIKTIMSSDKILVLDHGKVQEFDHPENLLSNENSLFSGIINQINQGIN